MRDYYSFVTFKTRTHRFWNFQTETGHFTKPVNIPIHNEMYLLETFPLLTNPSLPFWKWLRLSTNFFSKAKIWGKFGFSFLNETPEECHKKWGRGKSLNNFLKSWSFHTFLPIRLPFCWEATSTTLAHAQPVILWNWPKVQSICWEAPLVLICLL